MCIMHIAYGIDVLGFKANAVSRGLFSLFSPERVRQNVKIFSRNRRYT